MSDNDIFSSLSHLCCFLPFRSFSGIPFHASLATESQWAIPTPSTISVNVLLRIPEVPWGVGRRRRTSPLTRFESCLMHKSLMHKTQRPRDDSNAAVEYSAYTIGCFTQSTQGIGLQWWLARNSHIVRQISANELQNIKKIDFVDFTIYQISFQLRLKSLFPPSFR